MTSTSYCHAAPLAPWPWVNVDDTVWNFFNCALTNPDLNSEQIQLMNDTGLCLHKNCNCWQEYPQSYYPKWTAEVLEKCNITEAIGRTQFEPCIFHYFDVDVKGHFTSVEKFEAKPGEAESTWKSLLAIEVSWSFFIKREVVDPSPSSVHPRHGQEPSLLKNFLGPCFRCWRPSASSGLYSAKF